MFSPGDEVICVSDRPYNGIDRYSNSDFSPTWIVKGKSYTIRDFRLVGKIAGVRLVEVIGPNDASFGEEVFIGAKRFIKAPRKTDISIFEKFKKPISVLEDA